MDSAEYSAVDTGLCIAYCLIGRSLIKNNQAKKTSPASIEMVIARGKMVWVEKWLIIKLPKDEDAKYKNKDADEATAIICG